MKEITEFRINYDYAHLLFRANEGKDLGQLTKSIKVVQLTKDDPRYFQIPIISEQIKKKYNRAFFFGWEIKRNYSKKEIENASLFRIKIKTAFEPAGEECGTLYNERLACEICGANREQLSPLALKKGAVPSKDISRTIAGEVVVSEKFAIAIAQWGLKGITLKSIFFGKNLSDCYQLVASNELRLTSNTKAGDDPFTVTGSSKGSIYNISGYESKFDEEVHICPKGHLIGLNLLSEPYVFNNPVIKDFDFFATTQKVGVKRGLLRPEPIYLCSQAFKKMVEEEKLSGFDFEVAHIEG